MTHQRTAPVFTDLALAAIHRHMTGAFRVWTLAKSLDQNGGGRIRRADLDALAATCKVTRRTYFRWLHQAHQVGLFQESIFDIIRPLSLLKVAKLLKVDKLTRLVKLPAKKLTAKGWKAYVFASTHSGKPISRLKIKELTARPADGKIEEYKGISCRTQARYDHLAKTKRKKTIWITNRPGSQLALACEYGSEHTNFVYRDPKTGRQSLAHRRPDIRKAYGNPAIIRSNWEVNRKLDSAITSNHPIIGSRDNGKRTLFHKSRKKAEHAAKQNGKNDLNIDALYPSRHTASTVFYVSA